MRKIHDVGSFGNTKARAIAARQIAIAVALTIAPSVAGCGDASEHELDSEANELNGTFGKATPGSSLRGASPNYVRASRYALSSASVLSKLSVWVAGAPGASGEASQSVRGVVYVADGAGAPKALACATREVSVASTRAAGWLELPFDNRCEVKAGRYWLGLHSGAGEGVVRYGVSAARGALAHGADVFDDGAAAAFPGAARDDFRMSIFATAVDLNGSVPTEPPPTTPPVTPPVNPPPPPSTTLKYLNVDTGAAVDPLPMWGRLDCQDASRHQWIATGGDPHPLPDGAAQGNTSFRRLTVNDGDDFYGERCELGANAHNETTFANFHEGERRYTYFSLRLAPNYPLANQNWQVVAQMKQAQPSNNGGGTPVLALEARDGKWRLMQSTAVTAAEDTRELWSTAAQTNVWTRFMFDVVYSQDESQGSIQVHVDLDGDNRFDGAGESSPVMRTYTLKRESAGSSSDGVSEGESIPGHLRMGPYHNASVPSTYVDIDNVEVVIP